MCNNAYHESLVVGLWAALDGRHEEAGAVLSAAAQREAQAGGARSGAATEGDGAHAAAAPAAARTHTSAGRPSRVRRRGVVADSV